ncbi:SRPBCC family protein [Dyadobacter sp. CY345]|uniref:SRPBCC family protein n=1 Tax=Dyadobacter sp. CY345 TaxID=2909335 RepID=UPI001F2E51E7|nr:SRPBCC family protein [Dyadobacter sp. CY345]MCF2444800.1 SRPBCC family protein [Dyadobacter sp. CY345]
MNALKVILFVIVALVGLVLIVALFVKKDYTIEREVSINKPAAEVFDYIRYLKNQDHYNKWVMTDPDMKKEFKGSDGSIGFVYAWDGNDKAGKGEQEITRIETGKELDLEIRFIRPFEGTAHTKMITKPASENHTIVSWSMAGYSKYPMNITNLFTRAMLGKDLEKSLLNLKNILEK